jgi:arylsulfatase A-like enzyme
MLTGQNPHTAGMIGLAHRGFSLKNPRQHLASYLAEAGYETVLCGVQHEIAAGHEKELGYSQILEYTNPLFFDSPLSPQQMLDQRAAQDYANACAAADYLHQPRTRPFFLSLGLNATHFELPPPASDINPNYVQPPPTLPDNAITRRDMAGYHTLARQADLCLDIVLESLRQSAYADSTLVLFTTDHGLAFPWMKCTLYDSGIGVAMILRFPNGEHRGQVVDALVSHLDVYPTLCAIAGLPAPDWLEGHSLIPLLEGRTEMVRKEIFAEVTYHAAYEPMRCIRTERYKYIRYFDDFPDTVKPNIDWSASKDFLIEQGLRQRPHDPSEMLFDLVYDPAERLNLAANPQYAAIRSDLAGRLQLWMEATADPLLQGQVSKPPGALANRRSGLHPFETDWEV